VERPRTIERSHFLTHLYLHMLHALLQKLQTCFDVR
jgi:hypothetical protein